MEKTAAIDKAKSKVRGATGTKRSFKMEIRLISDVASRRKYESRLQKLDQKLKGFNADVKALEAEVNRGELFIESSGANNGNGSSKQQQDPTAAGDNMLKEAHGLQDKTQDSLMATKQMIAESKEVGVATLEELERQRAVITNIEKETDRIDDNLARAEKLLKQFGKRMASDHFIQCFAVINCLLLVGVLVYAIINKKGLGGDSEDAPFDPAGNFVSSFTGGGDERRYFFLRH